MHDDSSSRIADGLRTWIAQAPSGARLPSTRELVREYSAGPGTVQTAIRRLATEGVVETRPGVGTFVRAVRTARPHDFGWQTSALGTPARSPSPASAALDLPSGDALALHSGYPDTSLLPTRLVRAALTRSTRRDAGADRPPAAGLPELQAWFAQDLAAHGPTDVTPPAPAEVVIVPGSQTGLGAVFRSLVGPGRPILVESPTYWGALLAAAQVGVEVVPVPSGPRGPQAHQVADAFARTGARAFYAQPMFANPTGAMWEPELRAQVLDLVREHDAFLIEDDWAHDLAITADPAPLAAHDESGHVVHLRTFTKSISPALRVGAVVARGPARQRILEDVRAESMYVSGLLQSAVLDVVTQPGWRAHLRALRRELRSRRDLLATSLHEHAPEVEVTNIPGGGCHLWVRLADRLEPAEIVRRCADRGVRLTDGGEFFPAEPPGAYLRLSFTGANPGAYPQAARVLGEVVREA